MADSGDRETGGADAGQAAAPLSPGDRVPAEERKKLLARRVFDLTRENRAAVRSQGDFDAVLVRGRPTNNLLMFVTLVCVVALTALGGRILGDMGVGALAGIVAGGLFALLWLVLSLTGGEEIQRLAVDDRGTISSVTSGRSVDARGDFIKVAAPSAVLLICAFLAVSLARDIVNPPPPNCSGHATGTLDSDICPVLPNLANILTPTPSPTPSRQPTTSPVVSASGSAPSASAETSPSASPAPSGSSAAGGWTVGNEKLVEQLVRGLQLFFVIVAAAVAGGFLWMMLAGHWLFGIQPVRRRRGDG